MLEGEAWRRNSACVIDTAGYIKRSRDGVRISRKSDGNRKQPKKRETASKERVVRIGRSPRVGRQERRMRGYQVDESWKLGPSQKSGIKKKAIKASASVVPQFFIVRNMYLR